MDDDTTWQCKHFSELTVYEVYDILQLRSAVFVVEQNCIFPDIDGIDKHTYHLFGYRQKKLVACCRLIGKDIVYQNMTSIGRVVSSIDVRGTGIGRTMMKLSIQKCRDLFGILPIRIGAQFYLKDWYSSFGFVSCEDNYLEDGIEHIHMQLFFN